MPDDALESVLRLVAEGRLTADEARPILDALEERARRSGPPDDPEEATARPSMGGTGRALRVEVTEAGRKVVNLRVPLALGQDALGRIPGLSDAAAARIREAIESGLTGPVVVVDEPSGDGVRIVLE